MKILTFAATNHQDSINKKLIDYTAKLAQQKWSNSLEFETLDLNDFEMPIYRQDREKEGGIPEPAKKFFSHIGACDGLIISFAEHNGTFTAAYKNIHDWASRIDQKVFQQKRGLLLATSVGKRGGQGVLNSAVQIFPHFGMDVRASLSIPSFRDNFDSQSESLNNEELNNQLLEALEKFYQS